MERYATVRELADESGIPRRTIYAAAQRGELSAFLPNGSRRGMRIRPSEFVRWLESKETRRA
ncbi:MAG: helix-turn-helix domain-containing protein [Atopobiaceae bacterium]|nr:helix-turn-helix domain-containing protein [Atopobiaceae bacterium]